MSRAAFWCLLWIYSLEIDVHPPQGEERNEDSLNSIDPFMQRMYNCVIACMMLDYWHDLQYLWQSDDPFSLRVAVLAPDSQHLHPPPWSKLISCSTLKAAWLDGWVEDWATTAISRCSLNAWLWCTNLLEGGKTRWANMLLNVLNIMSFGQRN